MTWDTVAFVALICVGQAVYTAGVFLAGLSIGLARGWSRGFRRGWDAGAGNAVSHPNQS